MTLRSLLHLAVSSTLLLAGCSDSDPPSDPPTAGTHIGNPGSVRFSTAALLADEGSGGVPDADDVIADAEGTAFHLTEVRVGLRDIELDLPVGVACRDVEADLVEATCSDVERKVRVAGPFAANLLTGETTPPIVGVRVPAIAYPRIDYRVVDLADATDLLPTGDPLRVASFTATADFENASGSMMTLSIALDFTEDIRLENRDGVVLPPGGTMTVAFDTEGWFDGLRVGRCIAAGELRVEGATVFVDEDDDCDFEGTLRDNLTRSPRLIVTD